MAIDTAPTAPVQSTSRRAILAAAAGAAAAFAARAVADPPKVRAGVDGDVILGGENPTTGLTRITNNTNATVVLWAQSTSGKGFVGSSFSEIGVQGDSGSKVGVLGESTTGIGVQGITFATNQPASLGWAGGNGTGVQGYSNDGSGLAPAAKPKTGVFGYAAQDSGSVGVRGESPAGFGVYGKTTGTGFAGYFNGKVYMTQFLEMGEIATPATPGANKARLFVHDNGLGKTQLVVKFANGSVKVLATET